MLVSFFSSNCEIFIYLEATDNVNERLIWVDLEMSGLEIEKERIIEMAVCVTDSELTKIAQVRK